MLKNGSFTEGWTDMPPAGRLINQQPKGWQLRWIEPGKSLFGAGDRAGGIPECVHKLAKQLPPNEQKGAPDALILAGDTTYKIFNANAPFGAELRQVVTGLRPGSKAKLTVPVLAVLYGESDPFGAESGVWINGDGKWVNAGEMGNRNWHRHKIEFTVPENGRAEIAIRVKSKWPRPKDFFIDGIELNAEVHVDKPFPDESGEETKPEEKPTEETKPVTEAVKLSVPAGMQVITAASNEPGVVVVVVPSGINIELE